jgi:hypothetical protein
MSYIAYLCYPQQAWGDDLEDNEPEIKFEEPNRWMYEKVIPIQFSVLHSWSDKDKGLCK